MDVAEDLPCPWSARRTASCSRRRAPVVHAGVGPPTSRRKRHRRMRPPRADLRLPSRARARTILPESRIWKGITSSRRPSARAFAWQRTRTRPEPSAGRRPARERPSGPRGGRRRTPPAGSPASPAGARNAGSVTAPGKVASGISPGGHWGEPLCGFQVPGGRTRLTFCGGSNTASSRSSGPSGSPPSLADGVKDIHGAHPREAKEAPPGPAGAREARGLEATSAGAGRGPGRPWAPQWRAAPETLAGIPGSQTGLHGLAGELGACPPPAQGPGRCPPGIPVTEAASQGSRGEASASARSSTVAALRGRAKEGRNLIYRLRLPAVCSSRRYDGFELIS